MPPDFTTLRAEVDGRIGRLTLDQPTKLNPLGTVPLREIAEAAQWFDTTDAVVVIVTGEGRAFSSGFDLREFAGSSAAEDAMSSRDQADLGRLMAEAMERMSALTIAAIEGPGASAAAWCWRACATCGSLPTTPSSRFPRSTSGSRSAWGGIPTAGARDRAGDRPRAGADVPSVRRPTRRCSIGFVNRVVARAELESAVDELAEQLASKAPSVVRATKRQVNEALENVASTVGAWADADLLGAAMSDPEARAAARRYLASRGPDDPARGCTSVTRAIETQATATAGHRSLQEAVRVRRRTVSSAEEIGGDVVPQARGERE